MRYIFGLLALALSSCSLQGPTIEFVYNNKVIWCNNSRLQSTGYYSSHCTDLRVHSSITNVVIIHELKK